MSEVSTQISSPPYKFYEFLELPIYVLESFVRFVSFPYRHPTVLYHLHEIFYQIRIRVYPYRVIPYRLRVPEHLTVPYKFWKFWRL